MRLLNWGPGECSDRLTILSLKILFGTDAGKDVKHFVDERNALLADIRARTLNGRWFEAVLELAAVNAALWHAEDELREYRRLRDGKAPQYNTGMVEAVQAIAMRIQALNDQRAVLVERINKDSGDHVGPEKAHV